MNNHNNFYEGKRFVGGAAAARAAARKRQRMGGGNNNNNGHHHHHHRKRNRNHGCSPVEHLPKSMKPSDRFFASMLMSPVSDIARSNESGRVREKLMAEICERLSLPVPQKLPARYRNANEFYSTRASLVMEESRSILSEEISKHRSLSAASNKERRCKDGGRLLRCNLVSVEDRKRSRCSVLTFEKCDTVTEVRVSSGGVQRISTKAPFTPKELYDMKPGCTYLLQPPPPPPTTSDLEDETEVADDFESSFLGCVLPIKRGNDREGTNECISIMVFRELSKSRQEPEGVWDLIPLTTLISEVRQFEACTRATKVAFLPSLLAWKEAAHTRFVYSSDEESDDDPASDKDKYETEDSDETEDSGETEESNGGVDGDEKEIMGLADCKETNREHHHIDGDDNYNEEEDDDDSYDDEESPYVLPTLNETQEAAVHAFLGSPPATLCLVQGPPGTGKTTFLVSVIVRHLLLPSMSMTGNDDEGGGRQRSLVTAPTNKAITVLAERFLSALNGSQEFNIVMIGVEDKLVGNDGNDRDENNAIAVKNDNNDPFANDGNDLPSPLRKIFVYSWVETMIDEFKALAPLVQTDEASSLSLARTRAHRLRHNLLRSIPHLAKTSEAQSDVNDFVGLLDEMCKNNGVYDKGFLRTEAIKRLNELVSKLQSVEAGGAATQELLATADVIFCTLATAGIAAMKQTKRIDDLFVDEAAAATEPEICIPFHLGPTRMLAVGDPMQLPATVTSRHAANLGLNRSMHERLMYDCDKDHIMLDTQYRMHPEISLFPSKAFYRGRLKNGENVARKRNNTRTTPDPNLILDKRPYTVVQVEGRERKQHSFSGSYYNKEEAIAVVKAVRLVRDASVVRRAAANKKISSLSQEEEDAPSSSSAWDAPDRIRIITFYQGQVSMIRHLLRQQGLGKVLVSTVDSSQGCEADTVIVSFVRSSNNHETKNRGSARRAAGFLTDDRRINVAMTRAKHQLVVIGNVRGTLRRCGAPTLEAMVLDAEHRDCVVSTLK